jgi:hypothetical protein
VDASEHRAASNDFGAVFAGRDVATTFHQQAVNTLLEGRVADDIDHVTGLEGILGITMAAQVDNRTTTIANVPVTNHTVLSGKSPVALCRDQTGAVRNVCVNLCDPYYQTSDQSKQAVSHCRSPSTKSCFRLFFSMLLIYATALHPCSLLPCFEPLSNISLPHNKGIEPP